MAGRYRPRDDKPKWWHRWRKAQLQLHPQLQRGKNRQLRLSLREASLLCDVLEIQIEGMQDAKSHTERDPSFTEPDDYLFSIATYEEDISILERIRGRLVA